MTASILEEIAEYKREFVQRSKQEIPLAEVRARAADVKEPADFVGALQQAQIALIAEVKKASPSEGVIRTDFDPEQIAETYAENGASALSILTDEAYFQGSDAHLKLARHVSGLPSLRKDFTVDPYQIFEARVLGADAILLIVALMDGGQLEDLHGIGLELGLGVLVEVHSADELARTAFIEPLLVGINNRDLHTFETKIETTFELLPHVPSTATIVSESGIDNRKDVERLEAAGVDAILVGESLMRSNDMGAKVRELLGS